MNTLENNNNTFKQYLSKLTKQHIYSPVSFLIRSARGHLEWQMCSTVIHPDCTGSNPDFTGSTAARQTLTNQGAARDRDVVIIITNFNRA